MLHGGVASMPLLQALLVIWGFDAAALDRSPFVEIASVGHPVVRMCPVSKWLEASRVMAPRGFMQALQVSKLA